MTAVQTYTQALPHGIELSCRAAGQRGRPVLMFLHGFPEAAFVWDEVMLALAASEQGGFRCVAPNLRGYEHSSAPQEVAAYRAKHLMEDISALIAAECGPGQPLACLVAHDWGGAVAWNLANQRPALMRRLAIINSPHPGTFLRDLKTSPAQQAASAYMNFLIRPDAEQLLAEGDFKRLWAFFTAMGPAPWLTEAVRQRYRHVWQGDGSSPGAGLRGGCNYYRASPLRPPRPDDAAAAAIELPDNMLRIDLPTLVLWAMNDTALLPQLVQGLEHWVPRLRLERIAGATHWLVHEQPERVVQQLRQFVADA